MWHTETVFGITGGDRESRYGSVTLMVERLLVLSKDGDSKSTTLHGGSTVGLLCDRAGARDHVLPTPIRLESGLIK